MEDFKKSLKPDEWRLVTVTNLKLLSGLRMDFMHDGDMLRGLAALERLFLKHIPKPKPGPAIQWEVPDVPTSVQ